MKFRTEVEIPVSAAQISIEDKVFSIGSCFATEISDLLAKAQIQTFNNPFGTVFNPYSINNSLKKLHGSAFYAEEDLIKYNDEIISLDHHSTFSSRFLHQTLDQINRKIEEGNRFLQSTNWVIITYGTSFIYDFLPKNKLVANCHKIPAKFFNKRFLTHLELADSLYETVTLLKDICKDNVQILFTVSPVRHTKDGMVENNLSKAKLNTAIHEILPQFDNCHYLPIYEMMMDDLRDYRFYKEDLIHPNRQAIQYIWEKFREAYFTPETKAFVEENFKINKALEHKPSDEQDPKHQEFLQNLKAKITQQQAKVKHKIFIDEY